MQSSLLNQLKLNFYNIITHPIMHESLYMILRLQLHTILCIIIVIIQQASFLLELH